MAVVIASLIARRGQGSSHEATTFPYVAAGNGPGTRPAHERVRSDQSRSECVAWKRSPLLSAAIRVEGFWLAHWAKQQPVLRMLRLFRAVRALMREGTLRSDVAATYPLERVAEAVAHATAPGKGGKVILRLGERGA